MNEPDEDRLARRNALVGLIVVVALIACGLWLADILAAVSSIQDCVMQGRRNCVLFH
jgi:hypothetical protein